jgi:NAD(P)-dependent dehydrogenase (short-subunit alcohol dehydrogenase family)
LSHGVPAVGLEADITEPQQVFRALDKVLNDLGRVDILINNAANDSKVGGAGQSGLQWSRLENFPVDVWRQDLAVGLTGAFVSSQIFGGEMARARKREWC